MSQLVIISKFLILFYKNHPVPVKRNDGTREPDRLGEIRRWQGVDCRILSRLRLVEAARRP
jgi:hypothetical protein